LRRGGDCLLKPHKQGTITFKRTGRQIKARTFNITELGSTQAGDVRLRLILTSVPRLMFDVTTDLQGAKVGFADSADVGAMEEQSAGG
jgi:hypothetical protein